MAARCIELAGISLNADPRQPGGTAKYLVVDGPTFAEAQAAALAAIPQFATLAVPIGGGYASGAVELLGVDYGEMGGGVWSADARYGLPDAVSVAAPPEVPPGVPAPPQPPPPSQTGGQVDLFAEWAFDTTGGTEHITQSVETVSSQLSGDRGPGPSFLGAIGVGLDGSVQGCERVAPRLEWSVTCKAVKVNHDYIRLVASMTGSLNALPFAGREEEELLFLGASGQYRQGDGWVVTYRFAEGETQYNVKIPATADDPADQITLPSVKPFDYLWFRYKLGTVTVDGKQYNTSFPDQAIVERIYKRKQFHLLNI